ncbi:hypothetical protein [Ewingella americana]|uniref:DUF2786 domain-containing protein n=1 Tax=Ewingella americana TaxID=41202 RepID=A0A502GDB2_9GAMM|nr:hypothetical protein [Ewingella americana]TPG60089.1 hypothetical protein EAH77_16100 [Ewingella americana]
MANERTLVKLKKIYELALKGVGGEKDNAESLLQKLLAKHEMTLEDLVDSEEKVYQYCFPVKTIFERTLLTQILLKVLNAHTVYYTRYGKSKQKWYELTPTQFFEVDMLYGLYKQAWNKELEATISAFLSVNDIFPASENPNPSKRTKPISDEEMEAIWAKMSGMKPVKVHKQLSYSED